MAVFSNPVYTSTAAAHAAHNSEAQGTGRNLNMGFTITVQFHATAPERILVQEVRAKQCFKSVQR
jgi:hypothetical protein